MRHSTSNIAPRPFGHQFRALVRRTTARAAARARAARLQTPDQWSAATGVRVMGPDGWRRDRQSWDTPITEADFHDRVSVSTCIFPRDYWKTSAARRG